MYLAHCAPTAGPAKVITLTEYATYPLFALLVGVGAELGTRSSAPRWWVGPLVRGAVLVAAAEVLDGLYAQVWIVLAFLGVLTWTAAHLWRAPGRRWSSWSGWWRWSSPRGSTSWVPPGRPQASRRRDRARPLPVPGHGRPGYAGPYQIASMVFFAAIGILLARHLLPRAVGDTGDCWSASAVRSSLSFGSVCTRRAGSRCAAYDVSYRVLAFDGLLVVAVTLLVAVLADRVHRVAVPLAAMGAMSLTLYSLQIVWLDADLRVLGHSNDDTWRNVGRAGARLDGTRPGLARSGRGPSHGGAARSRARSPSWSGSCPDGVECLSDRATPTVTPSRCCGPTGAARRPTPRRTSSRTCAPARSCSTSARGRARSPPTWLRSSRPARSSPSRPRRGGGPHAAGCARGRRTRR